MTDNKLLVLGANAICVIVAGLLIARHPRDVIVWGLSLGIIYQHGLRLLLHTPGIPWMYLKIFTALGFLYALQKQYYEVAFIVGYSCLSKFVSGFSNQIPFVLIMSLLILIHACYFCGKTTDEKINY
jgi:hypothetical protein